eukprot:759529-Hanusia_phi.AAC.5
MGLSPTADPQIEQCGTDPFHEVLGVTDNLFVLLQMHRTVLLLVACAAPVMQISDAFSGQNFSLRSCSSLLNGLCSGTQYSAVEIRWKTTRN